MTRWRWPTAAKMRKLAPWLASGVAVFGLFVAVFLRRGDPDFGWHLEAGRYFLKHGVPATDVFTYTATDFPWINHEWLSDVITAVMFDAAGYWLVAGTFAGVWALAMVLAVGRRSWAMLALGFAAVATEVVARANAWTALGLALVLWLVRRPGKQWWLVPVFAVWANLHGGFVIGLAAVAVAAVWERRLWLVLAVCALATMVNPYGPRLYEEIWRTMADPHLRNQIGEWAPLDIGALNGFYIVLFLFAVMGMGWRRRELIFPAIVLLASVWSQRQFPLFVVASLGIVTAGYMKLKALLKVQAGWRAYIFPVLATVLAVVPVYKIARNPGNSHEPVRSVASLRSEPCRGRIFNDYNFGGYLIWKLPDDKVYIDGRMPSWEHNGQDYLMNWRRVLAEAEFARGEFARYDVGCALIEPAHGRLILQLRDEGWRESAADDGAVLLRRPE